MESNTEMVDFGKSIIVPSVLELAKQSIPKIPLRYQRADQDPPIVPGGESGPPVPVVDLRRLAIGDSASPEIDKLHSACKEWGFFQIINHGVPTSLLDEFRREIESFFNLPYDEKKLLWQNSESQEGFGQLFVVSDEQKLDWSDMFKITTLPLSLRNPHLFHKLPPKLRETLEAYSIEIKKLAIVILDHLAGALKMDVEEMRELFRDGVQSVRMNYYPPCPEPDKAIGFSAHSDADALTILYQLNEAEGLQIRKGGRWVAVKPLPNAFVVNIGDIMEIVSNGVYKSIEHRVSLNCSKERLSVATFYSSNLNSELGPAKSLVGPHNPAVFRRVMLEKYFKDFFARKLEGKSYLEHMRIENEGDHVC
ncbi:protein SRG1-like [Benincasa hispida]|uniref:protein SRG1-like n=1 Tax=Benincasa hispida TaxID=102211 RepID=UPI00190057FE|nr:protein SRG1-like [Benincasa hispida]XP_038883136.1 protein SRG1-like [Benincasa hispida]